MKGSFVAVVFGTSLLAASAALGAATQKASLSGSCVTVLQKNDVGVVDKSTVTCNASGRCACDGLSTVSYQTIAISAGNGANGLEHGFIELTGSRGSLVLKLRGEATSLGASTGTWSLGKATGAVASEALTRGGTYASSWTTNDPINGTMDATIRTALSFSCAVCSSPR